MAARSHTRPLVVAITLALAVGLAWVGPPASAARKDKGRIAFVRSHQIYTATTTGRRVRKLTSSGKNFQPQWSPNGRRIAFVHEGRAGHRDIWVMRANGHGKRRVTHLGDTTGTHVVTGREVAGVRGQRHTAVLQLQRLPAAQGALQGPLRQAGRAADRR